MVCGESWIPVFLVSLFLRSLNTKSRCLVVVVLTLTEYGVNNDLLYHMGQAVIAKQLLALYCSERSYNIILYNVFPSFTFLESLLVKDPIFSKEDAYVCDRKHQYERSCEKGLRMLELHKKYNITDEDDIRMLDRYIICE